MIWGYECIILSLAINHCAGFVDYEAIFNIARHILYCQINILTSIAKDLIGGPGTKKMRKRVNSNSVSNLDQNSPAVTGT